MHAHGFWARGWVIPAALMPQFFVQGEVTEPRTQADLSAGAGTQAARPPVAPPVPAAAPPVPVEVAPPEPVALPPVPVEVAPPEPVALPSVAVEVAPPEPVALPPVPLPVFPAVPVEPPVPLTLSPLVQPYSMRPSARTALNPANTNELRFI
jgi:hypothetical protein